MINIIGFQDDQESTVPMSIVTVVICSLWAWTLGRAIAFGPSQDIYCWRPQLHSNMWYTLTPIRCRLPQLQFVPMFFLFSQLPILFFGDIQTQLLSTLSLVSWQAFIPIFIIHIHREWFIFVWSILNTTLALAAIVLEPTLLLWKVGPGLLCVWFTLIELQLISHDVLLVHSRPVDTRQPRIV